MYTLNCLKNVGVLAEKWYLKCRIEYPVLMPPFNYINFSHPKVYVYKPLVSGHFYPYKCILVTIIPTSNEDLHLLHRLNHLEPNGLIKLLFSMVSANSQEGT